MKKPIVIPAVTRENNPTFIKNSLKLILASVVINIFGIEEIEKNVPPIFTIIATVRIYGVGLIFRIREIVIIKGIIIITVSILLINEENITEIVQSIDIRKRGFPLDSFIAKTPKN
jgi:hypothetical protein